MPSSTNEPGLQTNIPGVYARVLAGEGAPVTTPTGNVLIVGSFPSLEKGVATWSRTPGEITALDPSDVTLARIAQTAFRPLTGPQVGVPTRVGLTNVQPTTQASLHLKDSAAANTVLLKSKLWGKRGNGVVVKLVASGDKRLAMTVNVAGKNSPAQTISNIGSGVLGAFRCTSAELLIATDTCRLALNPAANLTWDWTRVCTTTAGVTETFLPNVIKVAPSTLTARALLTLVSDTLTVTVTGLDDTGTAATGLAIILPADTTVAKPIKAGGGSGATITWSRVDSITWSTTMSGYVTKPEVAGTAFSFDCTQTSPRLTLVDVAAEVNQFNDQGFYVNTLSPGAINYALSEMDKIVTGASSETLDATAPGLSVYANRVAFIRAVNAQSDYLTAEEEASPSYNPPYPFNSVADTTYRGSLAGGTETAADSGDYQEVLEDMLQEQVNFVVSFCDPADDALAQAVAALLDTHCKMAPVTANSTERQFAVGLRPTTYTLDGCKEAVSLLNTQYSVGTFFQKIRVVGPVGVAEVQDERYGALRMAAGKAALGIGQPLTYQRMGVLGTEQPWTIGKDDSDVISAGITALTKDAIGYKVLRGITAYLSGDQDFYCESSAVESWLYSVFDVRTQLSQYVGQPAIGLLNAQVVKGLVQNYLGNQKDRGFITDWRDVVVTQVGSKYKVSYALVPVFPFNFAIITATLYTA
jgi:hypothetical protein